MKKSPFLAAFLSILVPGLGQIYAGSGTRGAAIIVGAVLVGSMNILILPLISLANPEIPHGIFNPMTIWKYWIPRIAHDVISVWSIVYWIWAVADAAYTAKKSGMRP